MEVKPIKTDDDNRAALARIRELWDRQDEASRDELDVLATLVEAYEAKTIPVGDIDPIDMLKFCMEQGEHSQPDLAKLLGSRSRAAEILGRKRRLTLDMIRTLHKAWHIPVELLVVEPRGKRVKAKKAKRAAKSARKAS